MTVVPGFGILWPDGNRCAACISWDVDADSLALHRRRDRGFELYAALSWLRYDEVALPRMLEVLNGLGLKQTFFVCGWCLERYDSSLLSDSKPFVVRAGGGELIELPIDTTLSDWPHYAHVPDLGYVQSPKAPEAAIHVFRAELNAVYELGGLWITIWHPHVSGRPARMLAWAKLAEEMLERGGVWLATLDEIARHVRACSDDGTYDPPVVSLPYYESPPPEFEGSDR